MFIRLSSALLGFLLLTLPAFAIEVEATSESPVSAAAPELASRSLLVREAIRYPEAARAAGAEGTVVLRVWVRPDGSVSQVTVLRSSGRADFDEEGIRSLSLWRFNALDSATEAEQYGDLTLYFKL